MAQRFHAEVVHEQSALQADDEDLLLANRRQGIAAQTTGNYQLSFVWLPFQESARNAPGLQSPGHK